MTICFSWSIKCFTQSATDDHVSKWPYSEIDKIHVYKTLSTKCKAKCSNVKEHKEMYPASDTKPLLSNNFQLERDVVVVHGAIEGVCLMEKSDRATIINDWQNDTHFTKTNFAK